MVKKYLVFAGDTYYAEGGWNDFRGSFDSADDARDAGSLFEWMHIVDASTGEKISKDGAPYGSDDFWER